MLVIVIYSQPAMQTSVGVWVELGFIFIMFFVIAPCIAVAMGYAAWKGKPKSFDREMYWTAFVSVGAIAGFVIVYTLRAGGAWPLPLQLASLGLGALLFGVALGFGIGIFARRRSSLQD